MVMHLMIPENEDFNINEYLSDSNIKSSSSESENQLQNQLKTLQVIGIDIIKANPSGGTSWLGHIQLKISNGFCININKF